MLMHCQMDDCPSIKLVFYSNTPSRLVVIDVSVVLSRDPPAGRSFNFWTQTRESRIDTTSPGRARGVGLAAYIRDSLLVEHSPELDRLRLILRRDPTTGGYGHQFCYERSERRLEATVREARLVARHVLERIVLVRIIISRDVSEDLCPLGVRRTRESTVRSDVCLRVFTALGLTYRNTAL
jgi:hypothetical protein